MTIVTYRPRKRPTKLAQTAEIKVPRIVQHTPKGRAWKLPPDDPEAKARAVAFFERMGIKRREGGVNQAECKSASEVVSPAKPTSREHQRQQKTRGMVPGLYREA